MRWFGTHFKSWNLIHFDVITRTRKWNTFLNSFLLSKEHFFSWLRLFENNLSRNLLNSISSFYLWFEHCRLLSLSFSLNMYIISPWSNIFCMIFHYFLSLKISFSFCKWVNLYILNLFWIVFTWSNVFIFRQWLVITLYCWVSC